jgi:uncharacterized glyoxalase superfamily protein PhnB
MLWVNNVKETIDWYVNTLGFELKNYVEEWQWGEICKDDVNIMFAKPDEETHFEKPQFTGSLYMNTEDVDGWWEKLKDSPYVLYPINNFDYGMREFGIKDINGYILQFGQVISGVGS